MVLFADIITLGGHMSDLNPPMNSRDAARFLGVTEKTLANLRQRGTGPKFLAFSARCIRYKEADLVAWMNACAREKSLAKARKEPLQAAA